jgi:hypothetical protein
MFYLYLEKTTLENSRIRICNPAWYGSACPDPYKNVTDPEPCLLQVVVRLTVIRSEAIQYDSLERDPQNGYFMR